MELRFDTVADGPAVLALRPDVVVVATGGRPRTPPLEEGEALVATTWDIIGGAVTPSTGSILLFDDHGTEDALSCAERLISSGASLEIVSPDRFVGYEVTGTTYPAYLGTFYEHGVRLTPDLRMTAVRRTADRRLEVVLSSEYTGTDQTRVVDQVVVEHGSQPNDELWEELRPGSSNDGELDLEAYLALAPQAHVTRPDATYALFRVGDAVASRNIHAALYESRRLALAF